MKKYIVSVVMTKVTPGQVGIGLDGKVGQAPPDIDLRNVVAVCSADDAEAAYARCSHSARLEYPEHKIAVKVVIEANAADLDMEG